MFYQLPLLSIIIGFFLMFLPGSRPWHDLYKQYVWVPMKADIKRVKVESVILGKAPLTGLPQARKFNIKVAYEYSPREIFGPIARRNGFPKWMLLPLSRIYWESSPQTYTTVASARAAAEKILFKVSHTVYMNPEDYTQVSFFLVPLSNYAKMGIVLVIFGLFMLVAFISIKLRLKKDDSQDVKQNI